MGCLDNDVNNFENLMWITIKIIKIKKACTLNTRVQAKYAKLFKKSNVCMLNMRVQAKYAKLFKIKMRVR